MRHSRLVAGVIVYLAIGAFLTFASAWACALWGDACAVTKRDVVHIDPANIVGHNGLLQAQEFLFERYIGRARIDAGGMRFGLAKRIAEPHTQRPEGFPGWAPEWPTVQEPPSARARVYPPFEQASGFPCLAMWCAFDKTAWGRFVATPNYRETGFEPPDWVPHTKDTSWKRGLPLRIITLGFIANTVFWGLLAFVVWRGRRFARVVHRREIRSDAAWIVRARKPLRWVVLIGCLVLIAQRVAWPIVNGHFEVDEVFQQPHPPVLGFGYLGDHFRAPVDVDDNLPYLAEMNRRFMGNPIRYAEPVVVFLYDRAEPDTPVGEIVRLGPEAHTATIAWDDGTTSSHKFESAQLDESGLAFRIEGSRSINLGWNVGGSAVARLTGITLAYVVAFSLPLLIVLVGLTQKPLWRIGAVATRCPRCKYDLRESSETGCPECGWNRNDFDPDSHD